MVKNLSIQKNSLKGASFCFWQKLKKPFFVLAPMANVTDYAFRTMIAKYGKPDVMWNEFVSADGLVSAGKDKLLMDLKFSGKERPIVAQLFTGHPEAMRGAAKLCAELGFDGLDINMGCPDRAVEKQGGGAASMKDPKNAIAVLMAAREGWSSGASVSSKIQSDEKVVTLNKMRKMVIADPHKNLPSLPVLPFLPISIKTRIGYNKVDLDWLKTLLEIREPNLPALTVHLRTRKEMSDVPAHWELMLEIVKMRDEIQSDIDPSMRTHIIGNGDVESIADGLEKTKKYGCDGVMIGRGIFGTPWLFENCRNGVDARQRTPEERLEVMVEHTKLFEKTYCRSVTVGGKNEGKKQERGFKNFAVMKKHFKAYVSGWDNAKELRVKLMETDNAKQVSAIVKEYLKR